MRFTTFDGELIVERRIRRALIATIENLEIERRSDILYWEREFLEWYLDRKIEAEKIELHKDITEDELKQLEQLIDYLEL